MFHSRVLKSVVMASLAVLPLTACTPQSLNAITSLLKDSQLQSAQSGGLRNAQSFAEGKTRLGVQLPANQPASDDGASADSKSQALADPPLGTEPAQPAVPAEAKPETQPEPKPEVKPEAKPEPQPVAKPDAFPCARAIVRVRFGQFNLNPQAPVTSWKGYLTAEHAQLKLLQGIQLEANDQVLGNAEATLIKWDALTGPHYDGFIALVQAKAGEAPPVLKLVTPFGIKTIAFNELAFLNAIKPVDNFGNQFQITSYLLPPAADSCGVDAPVAEVPGHAFAGENEVVPEDPQAVAQPTPKPMLATELAPKTPGANMEPLQQMPQPSTTPSPQPTPTPQVLVTAKPVAEPVAKPSAAPPSSATPAPDGPLPLASLAP